MTIQSKHLVFEQVENPEIIRFTHLQNSQIWRTKYLTSEEYAERERILGQSEIAKEHQSNHARKQFAEYAQYLGLKYFVLKNLELPNTSETSQIVSSCETLNRVGWYTKPESSGNVQPVLSICVGGVFTSEENRGKGYASVMIERLNQFYDKLADAPGSPSFLKDKVMFLYSEVGDYYAKFGYISRHVPVHSVHHLDELLERYCGEEVQPEGRFLGFSGYEDLIDLQGNSFQEKMLQLQVTNPDLRVFSVKPSLAIYQWFKHRDIYISQKFLEKPPTRFGFALPTGSHIIWHHHWTNGVLYILKVHIVGEDNPESTLKKLLAACIREAIATKLTHLEFWDDEINKATHPSLFEVLSTIEDKTSLYQENSSRSAIRAPKSVDAENLIWHNNTKFCWF
ncbi:LAFE_0D05908g1_1 [Lachancea fermentati]|uniref:LAFE_0D05908g1_1 n=1 Tax=Lachancea fermentati TaxID=4955 RepID=A0A1G4MBF1_LACFM|nr:LAFE_0D05908g1_1 [Lachancea fermentati]